MYFMYSCSLFLCTLVCVYFVVVSLYKWNTQAQYVLGFPAGSALKNPPAVWVTWVRSLGWEDTLERGRAIHSRILAWRIPWTKSTGLQRVRHDWMTFTFMPHETYLTGVRIAWLWEQKWGISFIWGNETSPRSLYLSLEWCRSLTGGLQRSSSQADQHTHGCEREWHACRSLCGRRESFHAKKE